MKDLKEKKEDFNILRCFMNLYSFIVLLALLILTLQNTDINHPCLLSCVISLACCLILDGVYFSNVLKPVDHYLARDESPETIELMKWVRQNNKFYTKK